MMIDTIILDLDGTLLDTLEDLTNSVNYAMERYGRPGYTTGQIRSYVGNGAAKLIERALPMGKEDASYGQILALFREHYALHCQDTAAPYPGVLKMLAALKAQAYRMAIVSNKPDNAVKQLHRKYFADYVQTAVGECDGIEKKPAPDMVYRALSQLGSDASRAVYVGDSEVDVQTAGNVPMPCISVLWGFRTMQQLLAAGAAKEKMVRTPQELLLLLDPGRAE